MNALDALVVGIVLVYAALGYRRGFLVVGAELLALLAGLGVDFMTVLYERYVDERNRGASISQSVHTLMRHTLPGVIVGALTTAATFYAFLATDFRGMTELGFLTGSGIMVFLFCVIFVFPALLIVTERRREGKRKLKIHAFGTTKLVTASIARPRAVIIGWIVAILLLIAILVGAIGALVIELADARVGLEGRVRGPRNAILL